MTNNKKPVTGPVICTSLVLGGLLWGEIVHSRGATNGGPDYADAHFARYLATGGEASPGAPCPTSRDLRGGLMAATEQAKDLTTMAIAVAGGTIIVILQTSYLRPTQWALRTAYLLFPIGWFFLGKSIYYGSRLRAVYHSYLLSPKTNIACFAREAGDDAQRQIDCLTCALFVFTIWLTLYLIWWIWSNPTPKGAAIS